MKDSWLSVSVKVSRLTAILCKFEMMNDKDLDRMFYKLCIYWENK